MATDRSGLAWEVMAAFDDPATATFDAVLAAAGLDPMTARALRFWQRESVHNTKQYAASAIPAVLDAVAHAHADAQEATDRGAQAWIEAGHAVLAEAPGVIALPEPTAAQGEISSHDLLEMRRRTVAVRLAHLG